MATSESKIGGDFYFSFYTIIDMVLILLHYIYVYHLYEKTIINKQ